MADLSNHVSLSEYIQSMISKGHAKDLIVADLLQKGHEEQFAIELVQQNSQEYHSRQRTQGLNCILAGGAICLLSFGLSITSGITHFSFPVVLYGLTSLGILVGFTGFMKIF